MKQKFNPKTYLGSDRIQLPAQKGISKCWTWDKEISEYRCRSFEARKINYINGVKNTSKGHFNSLDEAKLWLYGVPAQVKCSSIIFRDALKSWLEHEVSHRAKTTQAFYSKMLRYFDFFLELHMEQINPLKVDEWIAFLKKNNKNDKRFTFDKELGVLSQIFKYHAVNHYGFVNPVNSNHSKKVRVKDAPPKDKNFLEPDFIKFRAELLKQENGLTLATLATVEYFHALRIGEVAALYWEDITFDNEHKKRRIKIVRSVKWIRNKNKETYIENNFKNSRYLVDNTKEYIIQPEVYEFLLAFKEASKGNSGLIFNDDGKPLDYRYIQYRYNKAFKDASLPFSATHVLRHGGTRNELEEHGDLTLSQQRLGNNSMETTKIYAQRSNRALENYTLEKYRKLEEKIQKK